jgi:hypothetical protein
MKKAPFPVLRLSDVSAAILANGVLLGASAYGNSAGSAPMFFTGESPSRWYLPSFSQSFRNIVQLGSGGLPGWGLN